MDKQKINLDKLYQERFQSFKMEQSSDIGLKMQKKLRFAKTLQLVKWISAGILITSIAITIAFLSINSNETQTQSRNTETKEGTKYNNLNKKTSTFETINEPKAYETSDKDITKSNITQGTVEQSAFRKEKPSFENEGKIVEKIEIRDEFVKDDDIEDKTTDTGEKTDENENALESGNYIPERSDNPKLLNSRFVKLEISQQKELEIKSIGKLSQQKKLEISNFNLNTGHRSGFFDDPETSVYGKHPSKLSGYFDLHFAPVVWQNNARWTTPDLDSTWTHSLKNNSQLSYEVGFSFQLHHQELPLFLQLGLDYQVLKEKIDYRFNRTYEDSDLSYWTYDSTWDIQNVLDTFYIIVDSNHFVIDSIYTLDTVLSNVDSLYNPVMSSAEKSKKHVNTYHYLNIPLLLGYQFQSKNKKWSYQVLAGAALAINLKNEGYYYTMNSDFNSYSGKVNPTIVWNFYAAVNINYRWKKWQFFAQPEFQYQINKSELTDQIPRRKYQLYKLKFGIRYQLF